MATHGCICSPPHPTPFVSPKTDKHFFAEALAELPTMAADRVDRRRGPVTSNANGHVMTG